MHFLALFFPVNTVTVRGGYNYWKFDSNFLRCSILQFPFPNSEEYKNSLLLFLGLTGVFF